MGCASYVVDKHKKCFTEVILMNSQNVYYGAKHYKECPKLTAKLFFCQELQTILRLYSSCPKKLYLVGKNFICKQCRHRSDFSCRSCLIKVFTFLHPFR